MRNLVNESESAESRRLVSFREAVFASAQGGI
jgi:hypothetical protein